MTEASLGADRRLHPRYPVMCAGELRVAGTFDWFVLNCQIRDISIAGVHVLVDRSLAPGDRLVLRIANVGDFPGEVAWAVDNRLGIRFDQAAQRLAELVRDDRLPSTSV